MQSLADVGYEFAEMDASVLYPTLDEAAFRRARQAVLSESLFPEVVHVPGLLSGTNGCQVELSLRDVFRRAALVGARTLLVQAPATAVAARGSAEAWRETTEALGLLGEHAARSGVDVFRVFDALNDPRNLQTALRAVKRAGKHAQAAISYAVTPAHTVEAYVALAEKLREAVGDAGEVLGPVECPIPRISGNYRYHALVRTSAFSQAHERTARVVEELKAARGVYVEPDVDPQALL